MEDAITDMLVCNFNWPLNIIHTGDFELYTNQRLFHYRKLETFWIKQLCCSTTVHTSVADWQFSTCSPLLAKARVYVPKAPTLVCMSTFLKSRNHNTQSMAYKQSKLRMKIYGSELPCLFKQLLAVIHYAV